MASFKFLQSSYPRSYFPVSPTWNFTMYFAHQRALSDNWYHEEEKGCKEGVQSRSDGFHRIHRTRIDSIGHVEFLFVRHLENCHQAIRGGRMSFRWSPSDPSDTNRFHRTCGVSVRKTLRKLSSSDQRGSKVVPMESIGSIGHVEFLFVRHLEKRHQSARRGRKSFRWIPSDPSDTNRFHRTCGVCRKTLRKL